MSHKQALAKVRVYEKYNRLHVQQRREISW